MHLGQLVVKNAARSPLRTAMTVVTLAIMLTAFVFPRTLVDAQEQALNDAPVNRVITFPRRGWTRPLPLRYSEEIRNMPGVDTAVGVRWAGFKLPGKDNLFFASNAVEAAPFIAMHFEVEAPEAEKRAFLADESSMLVSRDLAREQGWKLGDRVIFQHREHPGEWALTVACIYDPVGAEWAKRSLWVHYGFHNRGLPATERDQIGFISAKISEPNQGGRLSQEIDAHFAAAPVPTRSMEDRVLTAASLGRIGAVLTAFDVVSYLILAVVTSILINTLSLNVRERTHEFGVLRAIGFGPRHVVLLVLGEAAILGLMGGLLGLALSYPLLQGPVSAVLTERLQFPPTVVPLRVASMALLVTVGLALLAALAPAASLLRLEVRQALGRVS